MRLFYKICNRKIYFFFILSFHLLLLLPNYNSYQQELINYDYISLKDGLPAGTGVEAIAQDSLGFMWFSVLGGVAKYDGYKFNFYNNFYTENDTIFYPEIHSILIDSKNVLWVGSDNYIAYYNQNEDKFYSYKLTNDEEVHTVSVYSLKEGKNGLLWLGTSDRGIFSFNKETEQVINYTRNDQNPNSLHSDSITGLTIDVNGNLWIASYTKGLSKYDPDKNIFTRYKRDNVHHGLISDSTYAIYGDKDGSVWIAFKKYIGKLDPQTGKIEYFDIKGEGVNPAPVYSMFMDNEGILWMGTFREGIITFDKNLKEFISLKDATLNLQNKGTIYPYCIFQDRTGIIWIGGGELISKYYKRKQKFIYLSDSIEYQNVLRTSIVNEIKEDKEGNFWLGTSNGLYKYNSKSNSYKHFLKDKNPNRDPKMYGSNSVTGILFDRDNNMWLATYGGLYKFDTIESKIVYYVHDPDNKNSLDEGGVESILEDSKGNLWLAGDGAISKFDRVNEVFSHHKAPKIRSIYEDSNGIVWAFSGSMGVYKYNANQGRFIEYFNEKSLRSFSQAVEDDKNRFWIASFYSGLNLFDRNTGENISFGVNEGIPSNFINNLLIDNEGMIWLSTRLGLTRFDPETKYAKNFSEEDGLQFIDFQTTSSLKARSGELFFGGRNGVVRFMPAALNKTEPPIVITDFKVHNISITPSNSSIIKPINLSEEVNLSYGDNSFSVEFASLDYHSPARNQYAYMLEGIDEDWIYSGKERSVSYNNLGEGDYIFRVKGSNDDGVWNETGTFIRIVINPPWWRTWWFTTTWVLVSLVTFGGSIRFISTQKLKRKLRKAEHQQALDAERMRISKDMHDEVGSSLSRITLLSEIASKKAGDIDEIKKISKASREVVNNMDEIVWAVNPKNDSLENLSAYVLQYAQELFECIAITCRFEYPQAIPQIKLSSDVRHNIFLCIKEALNNIIKHSGASIVIISLEISKDLFEFSILDNGKGYDPEQIDRFSNGLSNMRKRIEDIKGEFKIESISHQGVKIIIKIRY